MQNETGTPRTHRAASARIGLRREELLSAGLALALLGLSIWALVTGFLLQQRHAQLEHTRDAQAVLRNLHQRRFEAVDSWNAIEAGRAQPGLLARLEDQAEISRLVERGERLYPAKHRGLIRTIGAGTDSVLSLFLESVRLRLDARGAISVGDSAGADRFEAQAFELQEAAERIYAQMERAEGAAERTLPFPLDELERDTAAVCLLSAAMLITAILIVWRQRALRRELEKSLGGARLVEEMLESYGRDLERANRELEEAALWKLQVLAEAGRDLNPALETLDGALRALADGTDSPAAQATVLGRAQSALRDISGQVGRLVALARNERAGVGTESHTFDAKLVVDRSVARVRPSIEGKGLALLVVPPAEGWPRVEADPSRLEQVVESLCRHALQRTGSGSIRLTGRLVEEASARLRIEVSDTGGPLDPLRIEELFRPTPRAALGVEADGHFMALGLARLVVRAMGGELGIENDGPRSGSRAWLTIPVAGRVVGGTPASGPSAATVDRRAA